MRRALVVAALLALALPAVAEDTKTDTCIGEKFVINGKTYCMVAVDPEDYYRTADQKKSPAPGSLVRMPDEPRPPHLKLAGHLMVNGMMTTQFDENRYNFTGRTDRYGRQPSDSSTSLSHERTGWGLSAQWSPDGKTWVEASWQRPERVGIVLDTSVLRYEYGWPCGRGYCPARVQATQTNTHDFVADDFALGILFDLSENKGKYFSLLLGGGVHRRYLRDHFRIHTESGELRYVTNASGIATLYEKADWRVDDETGATRARQTRIYGQLDLELYPAGKDRWVGLVLSTRVLSDGAREKNFPTSTLTDSEVLLGIQPGFYDVTARLVVRF